MLPVRYILSSYVTRAIYPQQLRYPCYISSAVTLPVRYILGSYVTRAIYPQQLRYPCDISSAVTLPVWYILSSYVTRVIYPQQLRYPCDISSAGYVPHPVGYNSPQQIIVSVWRTKFKFAGWRRIMAIFAHFKFYNLQWAATSDQITQQNSLQKAIGPERQ
jgi:hypothetical protein